jgi:hypothetical protein
MVILLIVIGVAIIVFLLITVFPKEIRGLWGKFRARDWQ